MHIHFSWCSVQIHKQVKKKKTQGNYVAEDVLSVKGSESNLGFLRDFISLSVCSMDLKSLLLALGTRYKRIKNSIIYIRSMLVKL